MSKKKTSIKLTKTSKLDGVKSFSFLAGKSCPGMHNSEICKNSPYCMTNFYKFPVVKNARLHNMEDIKRDDWEDDMVDLIKNENYFRWFDTGDIYNVSVAEKIYNVIKRTPNVKHWLPTNSYDVDGLKEWIDKIDELDNVKVRRSSKLFGKYEKGVHGSCVIVEEDIPDGVHVCPATLNHTKCGSCTACYDKNVDVIGYIAHGVLASKIKNGTFAKIK